ncbi:MAG: TonB-dependent receptor [Aureispira sp.]|nr:TonB-dependent receptor [Aureispira sp.]
MVRRILLMSLSLLISCGAAYAQTTGTLQGKVTDKETGESVPMATIVLEKDSIYAAGAASDMDGNFNFSSLEVGTYDLVTSAFGYPSLKIAGVKITAGGLIRLDVELPTSLDIPEITVIYEKPVIDVIPGPENISGDDLMNSAIANLEDAGGALKSGIVQKDAGEKTYSNGSRDDANVKMVDGERVYGDLGLAPSDIEEVQIITNSVPVEFGDGSGSFTNYITKRPSNQFRGYVAGETSQFLDAFGRNLVQASFSGPILMAPVLDFKGNPVMNKDKVKKQTIFGYRISGEFNTTKDSRPSALGSYQLTESKLEEIKANPLIPNEDGQGSTLALANITSDDLVKTKVRPNAQNSSGSFNAKLEFKPHQDLFVVLSGQGQFAWGKVPSVRNRLLNYEFNPQFKSNNFRILGRVRHTISSTVPNAEEEEKDILKKSTMLLQNLSYDLRLSYSQTNSKVEDPRYQDRFWEYGYVGKFYRNRRPVTDIVDTLWTLNTGGDTLGFEVAEGHHSFYTSFDGFEANNDINPGLAAYNQLIATAGNDVTNAVDYATTIEQMEVINGRFTGNRDDVFGLYNNAHINQSSFSKNNTNQLRAKANVNFDLVFNQKSGDPMRHQILIGGEFEQRIERSYSLSPFSLWDLANKHSNSHISNAADRSKATGEQYYDPISDRSYDLYEALIRNDNEGKEVSMSTFGSKLREKLGKEKGDWINVHELTPDQLSLDMFEATTLVGGRGAPLNYVGYDYLGKPLSTSTQFNDFFSQTDEQGRKTRPVAPNKPIYLAGYIQNQFTFKDIVARVGVRLDHYDANTKVLKDPYSVTGYYNASEFENSASPYNAGNNNEYKRPSNIQDDFAVYVNGNSEDAAVVGYRDGDQWFNSNGVPVNNPGELGSTVFPALKGFTTSEIDPQGQNYDPDAAFRDYKPTLVIMPRLVFSFPISEDANFYATYDVLAQRPTAGNFATPLTYYNFRETVADGNLIGNPNLKSQRTVNYEVGFQQKVTDRSSLKLSFLYKEQRDLIQMKQYVMAYPMTYTTFGNDDFATIKSFKLEYNMLAKNNLRMLANYTLAFAEGTGSNPTSSGGLAYDKELNYIFPLESDQRHTLKLMIDYRYKSGDKYNGPKIGKVDLLENTGINMIVNASSGTPYTAKQIPGGIGTSFPNRLTEGSVNGARMPWNVRIDMQVDRNIVIGKKSKTPFNLNVFLRIQNLLNTQNIMNVYAATGSPIDDGFLTHSGSAGPGFASTQPEAYQTLYNLRMENPFNISRPRRIVLGMRCFF